MITYSLAFFFGPGFPLTLGIKSAPSAAPAPRLTPFFLTPSVGGGIDVGTGVPLGAGVFDADSDGLSVAGLASTGNVFEVADDESFDGESSFLTGDSSNSLRNFGDSFRVMMRVGFDDDFRRALGVVDDLEGGDMVALVMNCGRGSLRIFVGWSKCSGHP